MQPRYLLPVLILALALALSLCFGCARRDEDPAASDSTADRSMQMVIDGEGYNMYRALKCHRCHGNTLKGTRKAPELTRLTEHYDAARLASYLANPDSMQRADPRLSELNQRFAAHDMPEYRIRARAMKVITDFLLQRDPELRPETSEEE